MNKDNLYYVNSPNVISNVIPSAIIQSDTRDPDYDNVVSKNTINITYSETDVSSSGYSGSVLPNYTKTGIFVVVPREITQDVSGSVYYTPLYQDEINYDTWKTRINKNFQELTWCQIKIIINKV